MKIVTIVPGDQKPEKVSQGDWDKIIKLGPIKDIPFGRAMENIRNSKGAYKLKQDAVPVEIQGGVMLTVDQMDATQLKLIIMNSGKKIQKQAMKMSDLRALAQRCIEETITVVDDDEVVQPDGKTT